jgi:hypothetical protein
MNLDAEAFQICKDFGLSPDQQEFVKQLIRPIFEIRQKEKLQRKQRLNEQLRAILKAEGLI